MLQKDGTCDFIMRKDQISKCLRWHEKIVRDRLDFIMTKQKRGKLHMMKFTLEKVGKISIDYKLFLQTESVLSSFKYSSPLNLLM